MENERRLFADEAQAQLKRHKALIEKLQKDNELLREELGGHKGMANMNTKNSGM